MSNIFDATLIWDIPLINPDDVEGRGPLKPSQRGRIVDAEAIYLDVVGITLNEQFLPVVLDGQPRLPGGPQNLVEELLEGRDDADPDVLEGISNDCHPDGTAATMGMGKEGSDTSDSFSFASRRDENSNRLGRMYEGLYCRR